MKNKLDLNKSQTNIVNALSKSPKSRFGLVKLGINASRKDLRFLERKDIIKSKEKYKNNTTIKGNQSTMYYIYSLA